MLLRKVKLSGHKGMTINYAEVKGSGVKSRRSREMPYRRARGQRFPCTKTAVSQHMPCRRSAFYLTNGPAGIESSGTEHIAR